MGPGVVNKVLLEHRLICLLITEDMCSHSLGFLYGPLQGKKKEGVSTLCLECGYWLVIFITNQLMIFLLNVFTKSITNGEMIHSVGK